MRCKARLQWAGPGNPVGAQVDRRPDTMHGRLAPPKPHAQREHLRRPGAELVEQWAARAPLREECRPVLIGPDGMYPGHRHPAATGSLERHQLTPQRAYLLGTKHPQRVLSPIPLQMPDGGVESASGPFHSRKAPDVEHQPEMLAAAQPGHMVPEARTVRN